MEGHVGEKQRRTHWDCPLYHSNNKNMNTGHSGTWSCLILYSHVPSDKPLFMDAVQIKRMLLLLGIRICRTHYLLYFWKCFVCEEPYGQTARFKQNKYGIFINKFPTLTVWSSLNTRCDECTVLERAKASIRQTMFSAKNSHRYRKKNERNP